MNPVISLIPYLALFSHVSFADNNVLAEAGLVPE